MHDVYLCLNNKRCKHSSRFLDNYDSALRAKRIDDVGMHLPACRSRSPTHTWTWLCWASHAAPQSTALQPRSSRVVICSTRSRGISWDSFLCCQENALHWKCKIQMHHPTSTLFSRPCLIRKKKNHLPDHINTDNVLEILSFQALARFPIMICTLKIKPFPVSNPNRQQTAEGVNLCAEHNPRTA